MIKSFVERLFGAEHGVYLAEMEAAPRLVPHGDHLDVWVWNSLKNSSMGIHEVRFRRDEHTVVFTGFQKLVTASSQNPGCFSFSYQELGIDPRRLAEHAMVWEDPDGKTTPLGLDSSEPEA